MAENKNTTILIVEDDPGILDLFQTIFFERGYKLMICAYGGSVSEKIKKQVPDLIILDIWIPGIDGLEVAKRLKSDKSTSNIPIILTSARGSLRKIADEAGVEDFLEKPFDIKVLLEKVAKNIAK